MTEFFLALVAVAVTSFGARDQRLVADLAERLGQGGGLLIVAMLSGAVTAAFMAFAGSWIGVLLPPAAKTMLVAFALIAAAVELAWFRAAKQVREPTRSLGATGIVLAAMQVGDGPRFLVFAIAAAFASPFLAAVGGFAGGAVAAAFGWAMAGDLEALPLKKIRRYGAVAIALFAIGVGLNARGIL